MFPVESAVADVASIAIDDVRAKPNCRFYYLYGWCAFGSRCKFAHVGKTKAHRLSGRATYSRVNKHVSKADDSELDVRKPETAVLQHLDDSDRSSCHSAVDHASGIPRVNISTTENVRGQVQTVTRPTVPLQFCRFFETRRRCPFGSRCRFVHDSAKPRIPVATYRKDVGRFSAEQEFHPLNPPAAPSRKVCVHYKRGSCRNGNNCRYRHPHQHPLLEMCQDRTDSSDTKSLGDKTNTSKEEPSLSTDVPSSGSLTREAVRKPEHFLGSLGDDDLISLRNVELAQLEKRFTKENLIHLQNDEGYVLTLASSDPDWPYDVQSVKLRVRFPVAYPKEVPITDVTCEDNDLLPLGLVRHLGRSVKSWFENEHAVNEAGGKVALTFRPFMKWFDKNLEELFTTGLKAVQKDIQAKEAGLEFVPHEMLSVRKTSNSDDSTAAVAEKPTEHIPPTLDQLVRLRKKSEKGVDAEEDDDHDSSLMSRLSLSGKPDAEVPAQMKPLDERDLNAAKRGTEIKLRNLQLGESVASVVCQKVCLMLQCSRCKVQQEVATEPRRRNLLSCKKCHHSHLVVFRTSLLHPYSACLGYLDLEGCQAFDLLLVHCIFLVECLSCNKQMTTDGLHYGKMWTSWCFHCNAKMAVYVDSAKFQFIQSTTSASGDTPTTVVKLDKREMKAKDPAIKEGKPLPNNGTCKHYKKSFRWFRFPCCGKVYPCDLCHNEKELEHEMKLATRIICGFCAKEQPFSSKPCATCSSNLTNMGRSHWEGGKGCRDRIKMSRDDRQKYSGVAKTVAKKGTTKRKEDSTSTKK